MTVRIAKILGLQEILDLSKKLNIYDEIPELLSMSLGAAETTLMNLTSAYAPFVNGGEKIEPKLTEEVLEIFNLKSTINSKKSFGGTSFENIKKMITKYKKLK